MQIRITKSRAAMAALFVLAGVGLGSLLSPLVGTALATAGQIVNISDRSGSAFFAKVSSDGKLAVGDGSGPLSVDGTVASRPAPPAFGWATRGIDFDAQDPPVPIAGPSASPINLTSLSVSTDAPSGEGIRVHLEAAHVPKTATTCSGATFDQTLWEILDAGDGTTPLSFTFPTPLQWKSPADTKACLFADADTIGGPTAVNAVGFYGG
jgi:hypothetical protein